MKSEIKRKIHIYNELKKQAISAFKNMELEKSLIYIKSASTLAWQDHLGIWYDDEFEKILKEIGIKIYKDRDTRKENNAKTSVELAFLTTKLKDIGGHSEVVGLWAKLLKKDFPNQNIYLSESKSSYPMLRKKFNDLGLYIYEFEPKDSHVERIRKLLNLLQSNKPESVILAIHPNDVVTVSSLAALPEKPNVIFYNHSDYNFWLGRNLIDYLVEYRKDGTRFSKKYRNISNPHIIPLSTDIKPKKSKKIKHDIPEKSTLSISIGGFNKILKKGKSNYFTVIQKILNKFPNHYHIFITNPPSDHVLDKYLKKCSEDIKNRFIIKGPIYDLSPIYDIADFLIETFPYGGGMVRIEAISCGVPIISFKSENYSVFSEIDELPDGYPYVANNNEDIIEYASQLIKNPEKRKKVSKLLLSFYQNNFHPDKIRDKLISIINGKRKKSNVRPTISKIESGEYMERYMKRSEANFPIYYNLLKNISKESDLFSFRTRFRYYLKSIFDEEIWFSKIFVGFALVVLGNKTSIYLKNLI